MPLRIRSGQQRALSAVSYSVAACAAAMTSRHNSLNLMNKLYERVCVCESNLKWADQQARGFAMRYTVLCWALLCSACDFLANCESYGSHIARHNDLSATHAEPLQAAPLLQQPTAVAHLRAKLKGRKSGARPLCCTIFTSAHQNCKLEPDAPLPVMQRRPCRRQPGTAYRERESEQITKRARKPLNLSRLQEQQSRQTKTSVPRIALIFLASEPSTRSTTLQLLSGESLIARLTCFFCVCAVSSSLSKELTRTSNKS